MLSEVWIWRKVSFFGLVEAFKSEMLMWHWVYFLYSSGPGIPLTIDLESEAFYEMWNGIVRRHIFWVFKACKKIYSLHFRFLKLRNHFRWVFLWSVGRASKYSVYLRKYFFRVLLEINNFCWPNVDLLFSNSFEGTISHTFSLKKWNDVLI